MRHSFLLCGLLILALISSSCGGGIPASSGQPTGGGPGTGGGSGSGGAGGGGTPPGGQNSQACSVMSTGVGASLNGFLPFSGGNLWNKDISSSAVDPNSTSIINFIGPSIGLHPDFGAGEYQGSNMGIPYVIVDGSQSFVSVNFTAYGDESDPGPMPVPSNASIEGDPNPGSGDRHVLVLDKNNCFLYELYSAYPQGNGS